MSQMKASVPETYIANGAMANQYRFVVVTAEYTVGYAGAGAIAFGINIDTAAAAGDGIAVAKPGDGTCKLVAGAAVAAGAVLKPDASARGITAATGQAYSARAIEAASAAGEIIEVSQEHGIAP